MKRTVRVTIEKEYEIELKDEILTQKHVDDFEQSFWELDGYSLEEKLSNLFEVAALRLAQGEERFIEGLGPCMSIFVKQYKPDADKMNVFYEETVDDIETEIVE